MIRAAVPILAIALTLLSACASNSRNSKSEGRTPPGSESAALGVGYPDPPRVLDEIWTRMEERDFAGMCGLLAGPGRSGKAVPLVPGRNLPPVDQLNSKVWLPPRFLTQTRDLMKRPWVRRISYGKPRVITNDPPFYAVPVIVQVDYDKVTPKERKMLVRIAQNQHTALDWEEIVAQGRAKEKRMLSGEEAPPELGFVFIDRWRFFADTPPTKR